MTASVTNSIEALQELYQQVKTLEAVYATQKILTFRPLPHGEQEKFFEAQDAVIRLVKGDNRSGKSACGAVEAIAHSLGERPWLPKDHPLRVVRLPGGRPMPVPNVGRVLAQDFQQAIKQNIWEKLVEWAPRGWYTIRKNNQGIPVEVNWSNGSKWYLMSDEQDDMVFEGTRGHWFWVDEPCGYKKFVALKRGLVDFGGHCWMTLTPLTQPWIADVIDSRAGDPDGEVVAFRFKVDDNEESRGGYLAREAIDSFVKDLRPDERAARVEGQWMHLTGRVFPEWVPREPYWVKPFKIPQHWPRICVIDPHPHKPIAVMWAAISPNDQIIVYRDLWDEELRTVSDVAQHIKQVEAANHETIAMRLIDAASKEHERTSGTNIKAKFAECGIWCMAAPKRNIQAGIDGIREALQVKYEWSEPRLIVFNTCPHVKRNFMRFIWAEWKSSRERDIKGARQEVVKNEDDFIACLRYIVQLDVNWHMLKREQRLVEEEAEEYEYESTTSQMIGAFDVWPTR